MDGMNEGFHLGLGIIVKLGLVLQCAVISSKRIHVGACSGL